MSALLSRLAVLADAYAAAPELSDDSAQALYRHFWRALWQQWTAVSCAYGVTFTPDDPYKTSAALFEAIESGSFRVFSGGNPLPRFHPLRFEAYACGDTLSRQTRNAIFRAVHDVYGHYARGECNSFSAVGETRAYQAHARTLPLAALPALTAETLAQVAWFYAGAHVRRADGTIPMPGDCDFVPLPQRPFAPQKACKLPAELWRPFLTMEV